jgi:hypothetical protein
MSLCFEGKNVVELARSATQLEVADGGSCHEQKYKNHCSVYFVVHAPLSYHIVSPSPASSNRWNEDDAWRIIAAGRHHL